MSKSKGKQVTYAIIGLGFISQRHIEAIRDTGGKLLMGCDLDKSKKHKIGDATFYTDYKDIIKDKDFEKIDYVSICTPNYLHKEMAITFLKLGKKVVVEKPVVIKEADIYDLALYNGNVNCIVQLRHNPELIAIKESIDPEEHYETEFNVGVYRDSWYHDSWKADIEKSGGLMFNIGIHYFDLLCWMFGKPIETKITEEAKGYAKGTVLFQNCRAKWELSVNKPIDNQHRYLMINGKNINLTDHFEGLHTRVYEDMLKGKTTSILDVEPAIKLVSKLYGI